MSRIIVAVSGASGACYARRLLHVLGQTDHQIHLTVSEAARKVIAQELTLNLNLRDGDDVVRHLAGEGGRVTYHHYQNVAAPIASGSFKTDGMVIAPCSMGTIGRIASGVSTGLIDRAADVCLKERRRLILVPRETPYTEIHLQNNETAFPRENLVLSLGLGAEVFVKENWGFELSARALGYLGDGYTDQERADVTLERATDTFSLGFQGQIGILYYLVR